MKYSLNWVEFLLAKKGAATKIKLAQPKDTTETWWKSKEGFKKKFYGTNSRRKMSFLNWLSVDHAPARIIKDSAANIKI